MKFKINRSRFLEGLKSVQNIVPGKGSLQIIQNVMLDGAGNELKLTTTDLDISIRTVCECEIVEHGVSTLPVKLLFAAVTKLAESEISVEIDAQERASISSGNTNYKLSGMPELDFPRLPKEEEAYAYKMPQAVLREMLRKVSYAASQDDTRKTLKGVLISFKDNKVVMVATDGRRLALVENELEFAKSAEKDIVLPSKTVQELQRSLTGDGEVSITVQNSQICFKLDNLVMYSKLIDDTYPNYKQVIPNEVREHISIDRQLLIDALDRASVMTMDEAHSTKLIFTSGKLTVTSAASNIGEVKDEVPIKYAGEKIEIVFNPNYVMEPLKAIDEDEITISLNDGHSPAIIKCGNENAGSPFLYVIMPLRIS